VNRRLGSGSIASLIGPMTRPGPLLTGCGGGHERRTSVEISVGLSAGFVGFSRLFLPFHATPDLGGNN
jgi:hypothetical protein